MAIRFGTLMFVALMCYCHNAFSALEQRDNVPSVVVTMICRDEAVNFKANLAKWIPSINYYVFMMDNRTTDGSSEVIRRILEPAGKHFRIVDNYQFTGFGPARTASLKMAWKYFPIADYVLIADPDWSADMSTIDLTQLDGSTDVYRFTAYDRNGFTKRKMDWLLRHREGLAMRYNLHEVLDIGPYTVKNIDWVVHEIEKPGSWHTTVGHANSFSAKRYEFDLQLLYKDLEEFGHDPHGHYYLGITHEAFASKSMPSLGRSHALVQHHGDLAIQYLTLRATANYDDEFVEQRWAVMFQLGVLYTELKPDELKAIYWLRMCRDYNPRQSECSLALLRLYLSLGQLEEALKEIDALLKQESSERLMLTYLNQAECNVPRAVLDVYSRKADAYGSLTYPEAMYLVLMYRRAHTAACREESQGKLLLSDNTRQIVNHVINSNTNDEMNRVILDHFQLPGDVDFCRNPQLQLYINTHAYTVDQGCTELMQAKQHARTCGIFRLVLPPAIEEKQVGTVANGFIGAAIIPDIVHHVFNGDVSALLDRPHTLRFLFAEYFNPLMVFNLIGQLQRERVTDFEIVVVSPNPAVHQLMQSRLSQCYGGGAEGGSGSTALLQAIQKNVVHVTSTLTQYLKETLAQLRAVDDRDSAQEENASESDPQREDADDNSMYVELEFDYVEYNGGISKTDDEAVAKKQLNDLRRLLRPPTPRSSSRGSGSHNYSSSSSSDTRNSSSAGGGGDDGGGGSSTVFAGGVLGLTYFADNHHVHAVRELVDRRNVLQIAPFSLEATRLVKQYLHQHDMSVFAVDEELIMLLGGGEHLGGKISAAGDGTGDHEGIRMLAWDPVIVRQMGIQHGSFKPYNASHIVPRVKWRTYSQTQVLREFLRICGNKTAAGGNNTNCSSGQEVKSDDDTDTGGGGGGGGGGKDDGVGWQVVSWVPTAFSRPFEELKHYEFLRFQALGLSQDSFLKHYLTSFRHTIYLTTQTDRSRTNTVSNSDSDNIASTAAAAAAANILDDHSGQGTRKEEAENNLNPIHIGRPKLNLSVFSSVHVKSNERERKDEEEEEEEEVLVSSMIRVIDRAGGLSNSLQSMPLNARARIASTIAFAHYSFAGDATSLPFVVNPLIGACMVHLSHKPTLQSLHAVNRAFALEQGLVFPEQEAQRLLLEFLAYLEALNVVTFESDDGPIHAIMSSSKPLPPVADTVGTGTGHTKGAGREGFGGLDVQQQGIGDPLDSSVESTLNGKRQNKSKKKSKSKKKKAKSKTKTKKQQQGITSKVARMRAMGWDEELVQEIIQREGLQDEEDQEGEEKDGGKGGDLDVATAPSKRQDAAAAAAVDEDEDDVEADLQQQMTGQQQQQQQQQQGKSFSSIVDLIEKEHDEFEFRYAQMEAREAAEAAEAAAVIVTDGEEEDDDDDEKKKDGGDEGGGGSSMERHQQRAMSAQSHEDHGDAATSSLSKLLKQSTTTKQASSQRDLVEAVLEATRDQGGRAKKQKQKQKQKQQLDASTIRASWEYQETARSRVVLPAETQTSEALLQSSFYRHPACMAITSRTNGKCQEPKKVKRRTANLGTTSALKVHFDSAQLEYINILRSRMKDDVGGSTVLRKLSDDHRVVAQQLRALGMDVSMGSDIYRLIKLNNHAKLKQYSSSFGRLMLYHGRDMSLSVGTQQQQQHNPEQDQEQEQEREERRVVGSRVHVGAMKYLGSIRDQLFANDYVVVDVILLEESLRALSSQLLQSTVWFDVTNGASFASHYDDGLAFPAVQTLVQQLTFALSTPEFPLHVTSFHAQAMNLTQPASHGPVMMANKGELMVVLWLNPTNSESADIALESEDSDAVAAYLAEKEERKSGWDGLRVYDDLCAGRLFSQGASIYPSAHADFLSRSSSVAIDLQTRCNPQQSEFIARRPNRMVIVRARKPSTFHSPGRSLDSLPWSEVEEVEGEEVTIDGTMNASTGKAAAAAAAAAGHAFPRSTMIALVITLAGV